ncbi:MAG TPA: GNAT family N-acetyltransferase [Rhodanobacteraceae bacterium]|nr:GNAT family N-acetyltransferase [Rhodanobacteraceae bacterium]
MRDAAERVRWSDEPDAAYRDWLQRSGAVFADPAWADPVARSLGSRVLYGFHAKRGEGVAVHLFRRLGVTVAFAGLPITPKWLADASVRELEIPGAELVRYNFSTLAANVAASCDERAVEQPESVIPDLGAWPVRGARKIRKDRAFAQRSGLRLDDLDASHAPDVDALYRATVTRHRGRLRYGVDYFRTIIGLAATNPRVAARGAFDEAGRVGGFAIFALDGTIAHYLHGGVAIEARARGASDLLLGDALDGMIARGAHSATLLPSPATQAGLLAFKRKWAEADGTWLTIDRPQGFVGTAIGKALALSARLRR